MKKDAESFTKWLQSVVAVVFTAWLGWVSLGLIGLQEDMRMVKYKLFGKIAETKQKTEVKQAGAGLPIPLPERKP